MRLLFIASLWMRLALWAAAADAPSVRVAVIGDGASQELSAQVAAELTHAGSVDLVEREEVAKVGDELRLRTMAASQPLELGRLLRADGLVFISQGSSSATVRLTGVGPGYVLFDTQIVSGADPLVDARAIAHQVADYSSKLKLAPGKSIPVSVLNLRCDIGSTRAVGLERNLTLLLESRLSAVAEYVVLERRHAGALGFERALDSGVRPLLPGGYLFLEKKIALSEPRQDLDVRAWEMKKLSILLGTELIARLDDSRSPRADDVRRALRRFTDYDPLHGKSGAHSPAASWLPPDTYTDRWALTLEEALAWLRLSCTAPDDHVEPHLITGQGKDFCPRFLKTPEAQAAAFREFVAGLRNDPAARLAALVIDTGSPEPVVADAACRAYLDALWPLREALSANQPRRREWTDLGRVPEPVRRRQAGAMIPLLRYYLTHAISFEFGTFCIRPMWLPSEWSEADAAAIWADEQVCKGRMEQDRQQRKFNAAWLNNEQAKLADPLFKKFPALATVGQAPDPGLTVARYWHPWRVAGNPGGRFFIVNAVAADGELFLFGYFRAENGLQARLYRVAAPKFETEVITLPAEHVSPGLMEVTPDAIEAAYGLMGDVPAGEAYRISRFDRHGRTWSTSVVTTPGAEYQHVCGATYVGLPDALAKLDPATGQMDLLISHRRKPPRNPLDGDESLRTPRVFAGPGNRPYVASESGVFYVQSEPGDWKLVCDIGVYASSVTRHGQTVVISNGEAVLLDPDRPEPEYLTPPDPGFYWGRYADEKETHPAKKPWRQPTVWDLPGQGQGTVSLTVDQVAWQGERFFVLSQPPAGESQRYELLAYHKNGGRKPVRVPLEFRLDEAARQALAPIHSGDQSPDGRMESIEHPGYGQTALKPIADLQGLWLYSAAGSVWFIPYSELDDYIKTHAPTAAGTTLPSDKGSG